METVPPFIRLLLWKGVTKAEDVLADTQLTLLIHVKIIFINHFSSFSFSPAVFTGKVSIPDYSYTAQDHSDDGSSFIRPSGCLFICLIVCIRLYFFFFFPLQSRYDFQTNTDSYRQHELIREMVVFLLLFFGLLHPYGVPF